MSLADWSMVSAACAAGFRAVSVLTIHRDWTDSLLLRQKRCTPFCRKVYTFGF